MTVRVSLTDGPFEPILQSFYSSVRLQYSQTKSMLHWVGSKGNLRAPDRQRLFFTDNIELGRKGGPVVQEIIVCVSAITSLNMADFQPQRRMLSSGKTDVIIIIAKGCFFLLLLMIIHQRYLFTFNQNCSTSYKFSVNDLMFLEG